MDKRENQLNFGVFQAGKARTAAEERGQHARAREDDEQRDHGTDFAVDPNRRVLCTANARWSSRKVAEKFANIEVNADQGGVQNGHYCDGPPGVTCVFDARVAR